MNGKSYLGGMTTIAKPVLFFAMLPALLQAQSGEPVAPPTPEEQTEPFTVVEEMPVFPGGETAMYAYFAEQVKYPDEALATGAQGKVYVRYVVGREGDISQVEIFRGPSVALNKEAERVVKAMPRWTPGRQKGKAVAVRMTLPVNFVLPKEPEKR